jgi:hypothetical protein
MLKIPNVHVHACMSMGNGSDRRTKRNGHHRDCDITSAVEDSDVRAGATD